MALEAFDILIKEVGQYNPVLRIIKDAITPIIFKDKVKRLNSKISLSNKFNKIDLDADSATINNIDNSSENPSYLFSSFKGSINDSFLFDDDIKQQQQSVEENDEGDNNFNYYETKTWYENLQELEKKISELNHQFKNGIITYLIILLLILFIEIQQKAIISKKYDNLLKEVDIEVELRTLKYKTKCKSFICFLLKLLNNYEKVMKYSKNIMI